MLCAGRTGVGKPTFNDEVDEMDERGDDTVELGASVPAPDSHELM